MSMVSIMERERTRKRPRLEWDVAPPPFPQAQRTFAVVGDEKKYASPPRRNDDRDGHYVFNLGENLTPRYKILGKMGEGTFGRVLECWDRQTRDYVAIKVIRSIQKYRDAAMIEVGVLERLVKSDVGCSRCVQIQKWFDYRNHICIVFEKLGPSLFDFLKRNKYCPFPVDLVREFGRQLLESVACLWILFLTSSVYSSCFIHISLGYKSTSFSLACLVCLRMQCIFVVSDLLYNMLLMHCHIQICMNYG
ncbi:Serine/threonine-protein kinase afc3, variant 4 [Lathyrus oleraceus]|uniref:Serine/threonine-protein kinase afc3, variant 4 n=1 Tax=Pisum sativum TaxID=3888 RepID=A0A9D4WKJ7_PEA|nr:Serine/threonine-protein kinase afc3, variant 4 [Pisum sativum]